MARRSGGIDPWSGGAAKSREQMLEHQFLAELTRTLMRQGHRCEVLRAEFDGSGHDVVLECDGVIRHVQLKAMRSDGKRRDVNIHVDLAAKPSGCVIWMLVDPETLLIEGYRWFGGAPGEPLPPLGDRVVRHSRANAQGQKAERPDLREAPKSAFVAIPTMEALIERLFGDEQGRDVVHLRSHLGRQPALPASAPLWLRLAQRGVFDALPDHLGEQEMIDFSHLVDGYALAAPGDGEEVQQMLAKPRPDLADLPDRPSDLWAAMFMEHRRLRFGQDELTANQQDWFAGVYSRLRQLLLA